MKRIKMLLKAVFAAVLLSGMIVQAQDIHNMHQKGSSDKKEMKMTEEKKDMLKVYACPMKEHENTLYANEGNGPICGMKMVEKEVKKVFICPMEEHQDKMYLEEGKCPVCGMKLIESKEIPENAKVKKAEEKKEEKEMPKDIMMDLDEDM